MKRFTLFAACGLLAATVSAQRPAGTFTANETVRSAFSPSMIAKVDSNLTPSSYGGQGCDTLRLYTFNVQGNPGGFIFGFNAFLDKQKGYMFNANGTVPGAGFAFGVKDLIDTTSMGGSYVAHIYTESSPGMWSLAASSTPVSYANIDTAFGQNGPGITPFLFMPAVQVNGNFLVTVDVYSQADTASGVALWSNGPTCGSDMSYEVYTGVTVADTISKISETWTGAGGSALLADPFMGITVQGFTGVETLTSNSLMAYPNPANNMVTVGFGAENAAQGTLEIMNLAGQVVLSQNIEVVSGKNMVEVNIADLASGVYAYQVKTGDQQMTGKLVVNH